MDLKNLKNNTIIICESADKKAFLKYFCQENIFLNVKFYSKKEFITKYLYATNEKALYYLVNKYHYKVNIAKMYLNNLYFILNKEYKSSKLNYLVNLKKELEENNLLEFTPLFKDYLKYEQIIVYNYPYLFNYELKIFEEVNAKIIKEKGLFNHKNIFKFLNNEEEINYICESISELLEKGIALNKIKICNVLEEDYNKIARIFNFYNIPIKIPTNNNLYCNEIGAEFLKNINLGIENALNSLEGSNPDIINKIVSILNKYAFVKDKTTLESLIVEDFKNTQIDNYNYQNYIEIVDLNNVTNSDYVFLMNFNAKTMPKFKKDEDYVTDNIKDEILEKSLKEINKEIKEYTINKINSIENIVITYSEKTGNQENYPSSLIREMNLEIISLNLNNKVSYAKTYTKLKYASLLDKFNKYGMTSPEYFLYKYNFGNIGYLKYDNNFKGLNESIPHNLTLSYTSLTDYNKCAFKYYVKFLLKLGKFEETFETYIGSLVHRVLEKTLLEQNDIKSEITKYLEEHPINITAKEKFFLTKVEGYIETIRSIIKNQNSYITLDNSLYEQKIKIPKDNVELLGFVDKILYKKTDERNIIAIIDYKTGHTVTDLKYIAYGFNMQLPFYLYLVKEAKLFANPVFAGFYIQNIFDLEVVKNNDKDYEEVLEDNLKLEGYTNNLDSIVKYLDNGFENSKLIKGLKVKNDGNFYSTSKTLSNEEMDKLTQIIDKVIKCNIEDILACKFTINPKKIANKINGCEFCEFKDLCFKKNANYVNLKDITDWREE